MGWERLKGQLVPGSHHGGAPSTEHRASGGDGMQAYLRRIATIPLLTPNEEVHLGTIGKRWQQSPSPTPAEVRSGRRALDRMVQANLRLVVSVCRHQLREPAGVELMDLIQAGNLGLIRAEVQGLEQRALRQLRAYLHPQAKEELASSLNG